MPAILSGNIKMRSVGKFSCVLGLSLLASASFATEEDAIKSVTAAGGKVTYDKVGKKKGVGGVVLSGAKVTDATMADLLQFPALTRVEIKNATKVTPDGAKELGKVKQLQTLDATGAFVSDDFAKSIAAATSITELKLEGGSLTDDGVKELAALTKLTTLTVAQNKKIRGTTVPALVAVKGLKYLTISNCELGDLAGWSAIKGLSTLALTQAVVNDAGLKEIAKMTQLKSLSLLGSPITDAGLAELKTLKALESLNLVDTNITEKAVPILSAMKKLDFLTIREKQVGKDGVAALKKALPNCDVNAMP
ncbi:MAG: hypothetical protein K8U57_08275 [Planctomycetes bacterium]|nr:hypothetical protein [Planctomycetota bacterium]